MKKDARLSNFAAVVDATKQHEVTRVISSLREDLEKEKYRYRELFHDYEGLKKKLELIEAVESKTLHPRPIEAALPTGQSEATAMAMLSDVHPYCRIRPATVLGKNEYTPAISSRRQRKFWRKIVELVKIERHGTEIRNLLLHFGGDLINNMLHDDSKETNYGTPQEELLFELSEIESGLDYVIDEGEFDTITCVCSGGNHDRETKYKQYENQAEHAYTWTLYHVLERIYRKRMEREKLKTKITFDIAQGYHIIKEVYGKKVRFHHGDDTMYFMGGVGGPTIGINKAIDKWNQTESVDLDCFGHWHWSMYDQRFIANGSVCGYSPYALCRKLPFEVPKQWFVLLDKKHWINDIRPIILD